MANRDVRTARARSRVRFGPEGSTLKEMVRQAKATYRSDVSAADAGAKSGIIFADAQRKPTHDIFAAARKESNAAHKDVGSIFSHLGAAADPFRAATAREQAGAAQRVALAGADALHELTQRKLEAKAGGQFARNQAKADYRSTRSSIHQKREDLNSRVGSFVVEEADSLHNARAKREADERARRATVRQSERNSLRTSGTDPDTGKPIKGGPLDPSAPRYKNKGGGPGKGKGAQSAEQHLKWQSDIQDILQAAGRLKGQSRAQMIGQLTKGQPERTYLAATRNYGAFKKGKPLPEGLSAKDKAAAGAIKVKLPAIPKYSADLRMSAALDIATGGHIGGTTRRRLRQAGFSINRLGLPNYHPPRPHPTPNHFHGARGG